MRTIVVAVDGSDPAAHALGTAVELARALGGALHLVYVLPPLVMPMEITSYASAELIQRQRAWAEGMVKDLRAKLPPELTVTSSIEDGAPADQIVEVAKRLDALMVVIGNTGRGAAGRFLVGSTADRVVHHCTKPVLVVR